MKKKILLYILLGLTIVILCMGKVFPAKASYDASNEAKSIVDTIISFNIENTLPENIGGTAEWYALGLSQYGRYDLTAYREALEEYVATKDIKGASAKLKFALYHT